MADLAAFLSVSHSNSFYFTNACNNDMLLYPETSNQSIHVGTTSNSSSVLQITSNSVNVVGDLNFTGSLKMNGGTYQWSNNSSNLFVMGSNVAIGRSNTTRALHVVGDVEFGSNIYMAQQPLFRGIRVMPFSNAPILNITSVVTAVQGYSNDTNGVNLVVPGVANTNYFRFVGGVSEIARLTGDGLLGIGTASPTTTLYIACNAAAPLLVTLCNSATGGTPAVLGLSNTGELLMSCASNHSLAFRTSNAERMRINSNGYVGIGTSLPSSVLHIASNAAAPVLLTLCNAPTGGMPATIGLSNTGELLLACASNLSISLSTSNVERMRVNSNGYVGIGTTVPTSTLHLASNAPAPVLVTLCNAATGGMPALVGLSNSGDIVLASTSNYSLSFQTSNVERMRVNSNGYIGLGTLFPNSILHLASNAAASVLVTMCNTATAGRPALVGLSNSGDMLLSCQSNYSISFQTSNIERLRVNSNGFIGVNQLAPAAQLDVNGNINCSSNLTVGTSNAPGYTSSYNMGMYRNRIINGEFLLFNASCGSCVLSGTARLNTIADKWELYSDSGFTAGLIGVTRNTLTSTDLPYTLAGHSYSMKLTVTTAAAYTSAIIYPRQNLQDTVDWRWGTSSGIPVMVSFWIRTNIANASVIPVTIVAWDTSVSNFRSYNMVVTVTNSGGWQQFTGSISAPPTTVAYTWPYLYIGGMNANTTANMSTWELGVKVGTSAWLAQNFWKTANNYIEVTGVQMEAGNIVTPFDRRPAATDSLSFGGNVTVQATNNLNIGTALVAAPQSATKSGSFYGCMNFYGISGNGMIAHYGFEGDLTSFIPTAQPGVLTGAALTYTPALGGTAAYFDHTDGSITAPTKYVNIYNAVPTSGAFSISFWFYLDSTNGSAWQPVAFGMQNGGTGSVYVNVNCNTGTLVINFTSTNNTGTSYAVNGFTRQTPHHVVMTFNGSSTATIYWNGAQRAQSTAVTSTSFTTTGNVQFSGNSYNSLNQGWRGWVDDFRVWNREVTSGEIWWLYTNPWPSLQLGFNGGLMSTAFNGYVWIPPKYGATQSFTFYTTYIDSYFGMKIYNFRIATVLVGVGSTPPTYWQGGLDNRFSSVAEFNYTAAGNLNKLSDIYTGDGPYTITWTASGKSNIVYNNNSWSPGGFEYPMYVQRLMW